MAEAEPEAPDAEAAGEPAPEAPDDGAPEDVLPAEADAAAEAAEAEAEAIRLAGRFTGLWSVGIPAGPGCSGMTSVVRLAAAPVIGGA